MTALTKIIANTAILGFRTYVCSNKIKYNENIEMSFEWKLDI